MIASLIDLAPHLVGHDATRARGYGVPMNFLTAMRYPCHDEDLIRSIFRSALAAPGLTLMGIEPLTRRTT